MAPNPDIHGDNDQDFADEHYSEPAVSETEPGYEISQKAAAEVIERDLNVQQNDRACRSSVESRTSRRIAPQKNAISAPPGRFAIRMGS